MIVLLGPPRSARHGGGAHVHLSVGDIVVGIHICTHGSLNPTLFAHMPALYTAPCFSSKGIMQL